MRYDYILRKKFMDMADVFYGVSEGPTSSQIKLAREAPDYSLVFCHSSQIESLFKTAKNKIFVVAQGDKGISEEFLQGMPDNILHLWVTNLCAAESSRATALPWGICDIDPTAIDLLDNGRSIKRPVAFSCFNLNSTNERKDRRNEIVKSKVVEHFDRLPHNKFIEQMNGSMFCISPNGNGVTCIRTWEALYCNTIPICTHSAAMHHFSDMPIIFVDNYSNLSIDRLMTKCGDLCWDNMHKLNFWWWRDSIFQRIADIKSSSGG